MTANNETPNKIIKLNKTNIVATVANIKIPSFQMVLLGIKQLFLTH